MRWVLVLTGAAVAVIVVGSLWPEREPQAREAGLRAYDSACDHFNAAVRFGQSARESKDEHEQRVVLERARREMNAALEDFERAARADPRHSKVADSARGFIHDRKVEDAGTLVDACREVKVGF